MTELYTTTDSASCSCPIHADGQPRTVPLGIDIADRVSVAPIDAETAEAIYQAHHSYMDDLPQVNIEHHGLYFDDQLCGAISYRQPLLNKLRVYIGPDDQVKRDLDAEDDPTQWHKLMVGGGGVIEANRICIGVPLRNLASCGFAKSMERFIDDHADRLDAEWLMTFVRSDHTGSMLKALLDKGWELAGISEPRQAGNRPDKDIRTYSKQRWMYPITDDPRSAQAPQTDVRGLAAD